MCVMCMYECCMYAMCVCMSVGYACLAFVAIIDVLDDLNQLCMYAQTVCMDMSELDESYPSKALTRSEEISRAQRDDPAETSGRINNRQIQT